MAYREAWLTRAQNTYGRVYTGWEAGRDMDALD
jgi:hypothetical protein